MKKHQSFISRSSSLYYNKHFDSGFIRIQIIWLPQGKSFSLKWCLTKLCFYSCFVTLDPSRSPNVSSRLSCLQHRVGRVLDGGALQAEKRTPILQYLTSLLPCLLFPPRLYMLPGHPALEWVQSTYVRWCGLMAPHLVRGLENIKSFAVNRNIAHNWV